MRVRWMLVLAIPVLLGGCYTWATIPPPVQPVIAEHEGDHVQVKVAGKSRFDLHEVQVVGDSLVGTTGAGDSYAVAVADVEYLRVQKTDTAKTGLVMGVVMATVALLIVAFVASWNAAGS